MKKSNKPVKVVSDVLKQNMEPKRNVSLSQNNMNNSSLISNMKLELSHIKIDVQRLMNQDSTIEHSLTPYKFQIQNQTLKKKLLKSQQAHNKIKYEFEQYRQEQLNRVKQIKQLINSNKQLQLRIEQVQVLKSNIEIEKLKLQTEYHRVDGIKSKLQKQQGLQQQFNSKISQQKFKLQSQNIKLQSELAKERQKGIQTKLLSKVNEEYQSIKIELKLTKQELLKHVQKLSQKDNEIKLLQEKIIQRQHLMNQQKQQQIQIKVQQLIRKYESELNEKDNIIKNFNLKIRQKEITISRFQTQLSIIKQQKKGLQVIIRNIEIQSTNTSNINNELHNTKEQSEKLKSKITSLENQNKKLIITIQQLQGLKVTLQSKLSSIINEKTKQILNLKSQLQSSRKLQTLVSSTSLSSQPETTSNKNYFSMQYQNLKKQMQILKMKMQALNKKVQVKSSELKKKDEFITNVIINKVKRESTEPEIEHFKQQISKYFSPTLHDKLINEQKEVMRLKEQIFTLQNN